MKAFVTGATGFIGRHLVPQLIENNYDVTCLVRDPGRAGDLAAQGAALAKGDVTERESMRAPMQGADVVFHLAGLYAVGVRDQAKMEAINVDGARQTLELAAELGVPRIVHTSTVAVFGNTRGRVVDETYRVEKAAMPSVYERTKWEAHYEVAVPLQAQGAPVIIVQPGGVTGAGDTAAHAATFEFFLNRMPVMLGAKSGLTLAHVDEIAAGHRLAAEKGLPGESYILCGPALTYRQIFEICSRITGQSFTNIWVPGWGASLAAGLTRLIERFGVEPALSSESLAMLADYTFWATADRARRELGWTTRPIEEVLEEVLADFMERCQSD